MGKDPAMAISYPAAVSAFSPLNTATTFAAANRPIASRVCAVALAMCGVITTWGRARNSNRSDGSASIAGSAS